MKLEIVNTTNTELGREYDFGIHAAGCADVARAKKRYGVQVYEQEHADAQAAITESEADFEAEGMSGFTYKVFPCCAKAAGDRSLTRPAGDIYERIEAVGGLPKGTAEPACEELRTKVGLAVQTFADEQQVLKALVALELLPEADEDEGCQGHESLAGEHMGETVFCDGSCATQ